MSGNNPDTQMDEASRRFMRDAQELGTDNSNLQNLSISGTTTNPRTNIGVTSPTTLVANVLAATNVSTQSAPKDNNNNPAPNVGSSSRTNVLPNLWDISTIKDHRSHNIDFYKTIYFKWCNVRGKDPSKMTVTGAMNSWYEFIKLYNEDRINSVIEKHRSNYERYKSMGYGSQYDSYDSGNQYRYPEREESTSQHSSSSSRKRKEYDPSDIPGPSQEYLGSRYDEVPRTSSRVDSPSTSHGSKYYRSSFCGSRYTPQRTGSL